MRKALIAVCLLLIVGLAAPAAASSKLRLFNRETGFVLSDGERYLAYGLYRGPDIHVLDTKTGRRVKWTVDPSCTSFFEQQRLMAAAHLLLHCTSGASLLDVRTGQQSPVPGSAVFVGTQWVAGYGPDCPDSRQRGYVFYNWHSGNTKIVCDWTDEGDRDVNDPSLGFVCPYAVHGIYPFGGQRYWDGDWLVRAIAPDGLHLVRCHGKVRRLDKLGSSADIGGGHVAWVHGEDHAKATALRSKSVHTWRVPRVKQHPGSFDEEDSIAVVLTRSLVFFTRPTEVLCDKLCDIVRVRVWSARLPSA